MTVETPVAVFRPTAFTNRERIIVAVGSLLCAGTFIGLGRLAGVPSEPTFSGSLLASSVPITALVITGVGIAICVMIATVVAAMITAEAGLFCICLGLAAYSVRCGSIRSVLQNASGPGALLLMALEVAVLAGLMCGAWWVLGWLLARVAGGHHAAQSAAAPNEVADVILQQRLMATGVQVLVMGICAVILIQSDTKAQTLAGVGVAAFVGAIAAYLFMPMPRGIWYWIGPGMVGLFGYLLAFLSPDGWQIGEVHGWASALAKPVPLDYISLGTAGALMGYWAIRRWSQPEVEPSDEPASAEVQPSPSV